VRTSDAQLWLAKHRPAIVAEGPRRSETVVEKIDVGDVLDTGEILSSDGTLYAEHGPGIWLSVDQACRAAYYGWERVEGMCSRDPKNGRVLLLMKRQGWPKLS
jgi:hypothetical protein